MKDYFINLGEGILDTFNAETQVKIECAMDNLDLYVDTAESISLTSNALHTNFLKYAFPENEQIGLRSDRHRSKRRRGFVAYSG
jgi:two-component sensor histidine kinase